MLFFVFFYLFSLLKRRGVINYTNHSQSKGLKTNLRTINFPYHRYLPRVIPWRLDRYRFDDKAPSFAKRVFALYEDTMMKGDS
jgi:hypothetical protein